MSLTIVNELSVHQQHALDRLRVHHGYHPVSAIGKGTYGSVLKVRKGDSYFAAKIVDKRMLNNMEVIMWPSLRHQNVLRLLRTFSENSAAVVFITAVLDTNLLRHLNNRDFKKDPRALERGRSYVKQVFQGMAYLHRRKLCHLDLRTDNIFLSTANDRAIVGDFSGLCWADTKRTFCPLPIAMRPPELLPKKEKVWPIPIDLWSCGLLLASVFVGKGFHLYTIKNKRAGTVQAVREYTAYYQCEAFVRTAISETYASGRLSSQALRSLVNLVGRLLRMGPGKRIGLDDALSHPFMSIDLFVGQAGLEDPVQDPANPLPEVFQDRDEKLVLASGGANGSAVLQASMSESDGESDVKSEHLKGASKWKKLKTRLQSGAKCKGFAAFFRRFKKAGRRKVKKDETIRESDKD